MQWPCRNLRLRSLCWLSWRLCCMLTPEICRRASAHLTTTSLRLFVLLHLIDVTARTRCTAQHSPAHFHSMHIAGQCRNSEADVARLNLDGCLDDEMLLIVDVFQGVWSSPQSGGDGQGRSEARRPRQRRRVCRYSSGDCVEPMSSRLFSRLSNSCVGRSSCSFDVDVGWLRSCNRRADYIQVTYQCIPRSETADICSTVRWIAHRTTFIVSPRYPQRYLPDLECVCSIVTQRNQRLLVRVAADSVLEATSNCRSDVLVVYDGSELTLARCGHLPPGLNFTSRTHAVLVAFRTGRRQQYKGFWLAVEALGRMSVACGSASVLLAKDTATEMTTSNALSNMTRGAHLQPANTSLSAENSKEPLQLDHIESHSTGDNVIYSSPRRVSALLVVIVSAIFLSATLCTVTVFAGIWLKKRRSQASITNSAVDNSYTPRYVSARQRRSTGSCSAPASATGTPQSRSHACSDVGSVSSSATTSRTRVSELSQEADGTLPPTAAASRDRDEVTDNNAGFMRDSGWNDNRPNVSPQHAAQSP